jgi:hypothetical protein
MQSWLYRATNPTESDSFLLFNPTQPYINNSKTKLSYEKKAFCYVTNQKKSNIFGGQSGDSVHVA